MALSKPSSLHALIIGINNYPDSNLPTLKAAISDADAFQRYLIEDLRVPAQNIRNLRGKNATRSSILSAFQSLRLDMDILYGDAIVIYYAGHGATAPTPPGWNIREGKIQMILPSDFGPFVHGILDRTIGTLLESIASSRGDNIVSAKNSFESGSFMTNIFRLLFLIVVSPDQVHVATVQKNRHAGSR